MTSFFPPMSSPSCCLPTPSVASTVRRSLPAPPSESLSLPIPPEPPDQPDSQICSSYGDLLAQPLLRLHVTGSNQCRSTDAPSPSLSRSTPPCQTFIQQSLMVVTPHRVNRRCGRRCCRRVAILPRSLNMKLGFHYLGFCVVSLLGLNGMGLFQDHKRKGFLLGLKISTSNLFLLLDRALSHLISLDAFHHQPPHLIKPRRLLSLVVRRVDCSKFSINTSLLPFPQVCSSLSPSASSTLGSLWMVDKSVVLVLWNSGLVLTSLMFLDSFGSTIVLFHGTLIALVRTFTAICRFYLELAHLEAALWQFKKRALLSSIVPDFLVHRDFYSPHLSFQELIILPNTSLLFSGIVIGSIVVKFVLLAEARIVVQDYSCSAFVDCLTQETLFPIGVSPLSLCLFMSDVVVLNLPLYTISLSVVDLVVLALCSFVVSSICGG